MPCLNVVTVVDTPIRWEFPRLDAVRRSSFYKAQLDVLAGCWAQFFAKISRYLDFRELDLSFLFLFV